MVTSLRVEDLTTIFRKITNVLNYSFCTGESEKRMESVICFMCMDSYTVAKSVELRVYECALSVGVTH